MLQYLGLVAQPCPGVVDQCGTAFDPQHGSTALDQRSCVVAGAASSVKDPLPGDVTDEAEDRRSVDVGVPGAGLGVRGEVVAVRAVVCEIRRHKVSVPDRRTILGRPRASRCASMG